MRGRVERRDAARAVVAVIGTVIALVLVVAPTGAQTTTTEPDGPTTSSAPTSGAIGSTTTLASTTTAAPATTAAPPTTEAAVVTTAPRTTVRVTTTRATTTTARATTTSSTTSTTTTTTTRPVVTSTTKALTISSSNLPPSSTSGNETESEIDRIVRLLFGVAGLSAVIGVAFAWHTSPRRRLRAAERRAAKAARRLDDAVAASFVGTAVAGADVRTGSSSGDDPEVDLSPADDSPTASFDHADEPSSRRRDPRPRPRPNDVPWT